MIEPRVYRAAFIPALLALVLAMFSLQCRPAPLPQGLAADVLFDGDEAAQLRRADRRPSSPTGARAGPATRRRRSWWRASSRAAGFQPASRAPALHARGPAARERDRPPGRRARAARSWSWPRATPRAVPDGARQRRRHRRAARAGARLRGPPVAQDARARLGRRLDARRGGHRAARRGARLAGASSTPCSWSRASARDGRGAVRRRRGRTTPRRAGIGLQRTVAGVDPPGARERGRRRRGARASSPGSRSRSASAPQGVLLDERLRRGAHLGQRRAAAGGRRPGRGDRRGPARRARPRHAAHGHRARPGPPPGARARSVRARGEPGAARLGAGAARRHAAAARARGRRSTPSPARAGAASRRAPVAALASAPGSRPSWPGWPSPSCSRSPGPRPSPPPAPVPPAELPLDGPALGVLGGRGARRCCWPCCSARWLAARPGSLRSSSPASPGAGVAVAARAQRRLAGALAREPLRRAARGARGAPVDARRARRGRRRAGARASLMLAAGLLPPLLVALYYLVRASLDPLDGRLVPADAGDRAQRRLRPRRWSGCLLLGALACATAELAWRLPGEPSSRRRASAARRVFGPGAYAGPGLARRHAARRCSR